MCCLFGLIDPQLRFSGKDKSRMLHALASASEARGTDATGIAYDTGGTLCIYKRPIPGHKLNFYLRDDTRFGMGHTRMTTQGSARKNRNNHPFRGVLRTGTFALAHNGVLYNDQKLRRELHLHRTQIETDSYIAVQLIEQKGILNFDSLRYMAEQLEGSFTITVLDDAGRLYIVKGDNPFCLCFYPDSGLYLYASTEEILQRGLSKLRLMLGQHEQIRLSDGDILRIDAAGGLNRQWFDASNLVRRWYGMPWPYGDSCDLWRPGRSDPQDSYLEELKNMAPSFGYTPEAIDRLAASGMVPEEIEEVLYCGCCGEL